MPNCDRCGTSEFVDLALSDGNLTCYNCGKVVDDSQNFTNEVDLVSTGGRTRACGSTVSLTSNGITASTSVPRNNSVHRRTEINPVQKQIDIIGNKLHVGETLLSQMHHMHCTLEKEEKYTRSPDVLAAAIVYIILRQNHKPFTLLDLSQAIQKNVFVVGRVYDLVLRRNKGIRVYEVHPSIFVDKVCKEIDHISPTVLNTIKTYANQIINTIKPHWVHTGKRLDAVCVAAIYIAAEAAGAFSSLKDLCHAIKAGEGTAKNRMREIKKELMQITAPKLPWLREINIKDMHKHLGKMLSQLETITRLTEARNAPQPQSSQNQNGSETPSPALPKTTPSLAAGSTTSNTNLNTYISGNPTTNTNTSTKEDFSTSQNPLPHAFLSSMAARSRRQHKLENAKRRLRESFEKEPELANYCSPSMVASLASLPPIPTPPSPPPPPPLLFHSSSSSETRSYPVAPAYQRRSPPPTPSQSPPSPSSPSSSSSTGRTFAELANASAKPANSAALSLRRRRAKADPKPEKEKSPAIVLPFLDHEDLVIEKLLMKGVSEAQILDGYYFSEQLSEVKHASFHSEAVGEDDIPDSEMNSFIRTQAEVDILTSFEDRNTLLLEGESKKRKKKGSSKRRSKQQKKNEEEEEAKEKEAEVESEVDGHNANNTDAEVESEVDGHNANNIETEVESEVETGEEPLRDSRERLRSAV